MDGLWHERPAHEEDGDAGADDDEDATAHGSEAAEAEPADGAAEAEPEAELALLVDQYVAPVEVLARLAAHRAALLAGLDEAPPRAPPLVLRRGRTKRLFCRRDALATIRLWRVLAECATNLRAGRSATLRSVYYRLKGDGVVTSPAQARGGGRRCSRGV